MSKTNPVALTEFFDKVKEAESTLEIMACSELVASETQLAINFVAESLHKAITEYEPILNSLLDNLKNEGSLQK